LKQASGGFSPQRMNGPGRYFRKRRKDEPAPGQAGVRHLERGMEDDPAAGQKDVDINAAGAVSARRPSFHLSFQGLAQGEQG
jgi:hypothetical protein